MQPTVQRLYSLLFALSLLALNPWGETRGEIWTVPKIGVLIAIYGLNLVLLWRKPLRFHSYPWLSFIFWGAWLALGAIAVLESPVPRRAFWGQDEMGDGWFYWAVLGNFTLSNTALLRHYPHLLRSQIKGLLLGGVVLVLAMIPQLIDWRIDYTQTMGELLQPGILRSTVFQDHQPIGTYSHRGHVAFVLSFLCILLLLLRRWHWLSRRNTVLGLALFGGMLWMLRTRVGILVFVVGVLYLLGRRYKRTMIALCLLGVLLMGLITFSRPIEGLPLIKQITSDRVYLWQLGRSGIRQRPLWGWGFDGFGVAYAYLVEKHSDNSRHIEVIHDVYYEAITPEGTVEFELLISNKAHNLILDTWISTGVFGLISYLGLLGFYTYSAYQAPLARLEVVVIVYLTFTFTWFEAAQFSHLVWWGLSLAWYRPHVVPQASMTNRRLPPAGKPPEDESPDETGDSLSSSLST